MDLLGDVLSTLELRSSLYFRAELSAPFAISVAEAGHAIRFHVVSDGACRIAVAGGAACPLGAGDLVLVPHGAAHVLADSDSTPPRPLPGVIEETGFDGTGPLRFGGDGAVARLVCGHFAFGHEPTHPLIASLPPLLLVRARDGADFAWLGALLAHVDAESRARADGWAEIVRRLSEVLFVTVLREYMGHSPHSPAALQALADPGLGAALRAFHREPGADWTLDALARHASMSRSVFAEQFRERLGITPARYVTLWRMHRARSLLDHSDLGAGEIGWRVGYASEAAFNRAFRQHFGVPPGRYRSASSGRRAA